MKKFNSKSELIEAKAQYSAQFGGAIEIERKEAEGALVWVHEDHAKVLGKTAGWHIGEFGYAAA